MRSEKARLGLALVSLLGLFGCGELHTEDPFVVPLEGQTRDGEFIPNQYIFFFRNGIADTERSRTKDQFANWGGTVLRELELFNAFGGEIDAAGLAVMRRNFFLAAVTINGIVQATGIQSCPPWGLDVSDQSGGIEQSGFFSYPSEGTGVHVYVLDSGIQRQKKNGAGIPVDGFFHEEFLTASSTYRLGEGHCTLSGCTPLPMNPSPIEWDDDHGHGTHLAGVVGGSLNGVAKDATLHAVRIAASNNKCEAPIGNTITVMDGLQSVVDLQQKLANQSMPPKAPPAVVLIGFSNNIGDSWNNTFDKLNSFATDNNLVIVTSAGNTGQNPLASNACTHFPGGVPSGKMPEERRVITVGAFNEFGQMWPQSNRGDCVDLLAPGTRIPGPISDDCPANAMGSTSRTAKFDGTSQAAAHVAGVAALLLERGLSPSEVKPTLIAMARKDVLTLGDSKTPNRALRSLFASDDIVSSPADDPTNPSCVPIPPGGNFVCSPAGICGVCGAEGTNCCPSSIPYCANGLECEAIGVCQAPEAPCGGEMEQCCGTECDNGLACENGTCMKCGYPPKSDGTKYPCCNGECFGSGVACGGNNQCIACGKADEPCCDSTCLHDTLTCSNGTCKTCGLPPLNGVPYPCCDGACLGNLNCNGKNECEVPSVGAPCGGHGQPCCLSADKQCQGDMVCDYNAEATGGTCIAKCRVRCGNGKLGHAENGLKFVTKIDCIQWAEEMCSQQQPAWVSRVFFNGEQIDGIDNCGETGESCCLTPPQCTETGKSCVSNHFMTAETVCAGGNVVNGPCPDNIVKIGEFSGQAKCQ